MLMIIEIRVLTPATTVPLSGWCATSDYTNPITFAVQIYLYGLTKILQYAFCDVLPYRGNTYACGQVVEPKDHGCQS
jgi:hypothetical protein